MDSTEAFAIQARLFQRWLLGATDAQSEAARQALVRLSALYAAGLDLPGAWPAGIATANEVERLTDDEWRRALEASKRLPFDMYSQIFNPIIVPAEEPVVGSISDDLADIYRDVAGGLRAYEKGDSAAAAWKWSFDLRWHWGAHATSAIRVLHCWLVENAVDLNAPP